MSLPTLEIENGCLLNIEEVFVCDDVEVPWVRGEMYSANSSRQTKAVITEENAFVWGNKLYWGVVWVHEFSTGYTASCIQLMPSDESYSKILGLNSKYWKRKRKYWDTQDEIKNPV